jgi:hexokinase
MKTILKTVTQFLRRYEMDYQDIDMDSNIAAFHLEMQRGLAGRKSSLDMIATYIEAGAEVPSNKRVVVADAGGTNFRAATVYFDDHKKPVIENLHLYPMPGVKSEIGKTEFFKTIAGYLKDAAKASDRIGFCFSYPVEMQPNKDGRLIRFSKEIKAPQVIGELIGKNLNCALAAAGLGGDKSIVLLNDTVVTLLAGLNYQNRNFGGYIGFILGTGTNCCYSEKNSNIKKKKDLDCAKSQIINIESGGFGKSHRGKLDLAFDKTTNNPGINKFEKMISGAYLGSLYFKTLQKACADQLFSPAASDAICKLPGLETRDMNAFMLYPHSDNLLAKICKTGGDNDILAAYHIADRLTERAAKLTAINLASVAIHSGQGTDPTRPICIIAEGTTFYHMKSLKSRVEFYLKQYLENKCGIYFDLVQVENATLIGAAIAGLTN